MGINKVNTEKKKAMLLALESNLGVVTTACSDVGISRTTHYMWLKSDLEYKSSVAEIESVALDFAESMLHKRMREGDTTSIIFFLKCKGKKRGYVDKVKNEEDTTKVLPMQIDSEHKEKWSNL